MASYESVQRAPLWILVAGVGLILALGGFFAESRLVGAMLVLGAIVFGVLAAMFGTLTVRDEGDHLSVRFGPLPLWGTSIRYDEIRSVRPARSSLIDGWGIHKIPGRGWTFNLWGRDCVELTTSRRRLRIGTEDPEGLADYLLKRSGADEAA